MEDEEGSKLLFSSQPRSFKMDVSSPQASKLKDAVSEKLMEFLGNYTDDVLAEYIVVLVCNGKHQNQARDDLEAFLGDKTKGFIAWLWNYLSDGSYISLPPSTFSVMNALGTTLNSDNANKEYTNGRIISGQMQSSGSCQVLLHNDSGPSVLSSNLIPSHAINPSEDLQRWNPDSSAPLTELYIEKPQTHAHVDVNHQEEAIKTNYSRVRSSCEISAGSEGDFPQKKPVRSNLMEEERHLLYKCLPTSKILKSVITEDHDSRLLSKASPRNLSSKSTDIVPYNLHSRGSVWDRLGKPSKDNEASIGVDDDWHDEGRRVDLTAKELDQRRLVQAISGDIPVRKTSVKNAVLGRSSENIVSNSRSDHIAGEAISITESIIEGNTLRRKRNFSDLGHEHNSTPSACRKKDCKEKGPSHKLMRLSYANKTVQLPQAPSTASDFTSTETHTSAQRSTRPYRLNCITEDTISEPKKSDVLDVKSKLQQIKMEMLRLRAKQSEMSKSLTTVPASNIQGLQNHFEDIESRTIFVSNVHFAASKEALSLHFVKCGEIVNVILLSDTFTGQPKGSAYVVFATKDSAEKALSLSGTSFFSRVLKVIRKRDMPGGTKSSNQPAGKAMQPYYPPSLKNSNLQRQHSSSHLQWRRDQLSGKETS